MPEGTAREQIPEMLRAMLAERFHLAAHRESREQIVYALTVAPGGLKVKEVASTAERSDIPFPNGANGRALIGMIRADDGVLGTVSRLQGQTFFESSKINMAELSGVLGKYLDDPVLDQTNLKGFYEVKLETPSYFGTGALRARLNPASDAEPEASVLHTVGTLGLKLEHRKMEVECLVVDRVDKMPTDN